MLKMLCQSISVLLCGAMLCGAASAQEGSRDADRPPSPIGGIVTPHSRAVDLVIALDVSGSMSGLIDSARQRLWDVVNELGRAQPQPRLRVAILSFGDPAYGAESGYVRVDQPFTRDLDSVNKTLFALRTNGGDEYVARVVDRSVRTLDWTDDAGALKVLFVAGNEAADQDPKISVLAATHAAASRGIVVNTIYCGNEGDDLFAGWREVAMATNGLYASINQQAGAVANVATPMDDELLRLNEELNDTYVAFGKDGRRYRDNQRAQDANASAMSPAAAASRTAVKASALYEAAEWDLVDAVKSGKQLAEVATEELPEALRDMNQEEREAYVAEKNEQRQRLKSRIAQLDAERRDFIDRERAKNGKAADTALDAVMQNGLRTLAKQKGFSFER